MFLIRSAFWLGLAMIVIQPQGWDFGAKADALSSAAVDAGKKVVVQQVMNTQCDSIECVGGKAILLASGISHNPSQASTMQDSLGLKLAPVPRPRPAWAG